MKKIFSILILFETVFSNLRIKNHKKKRKLDELPIPDLPDADFEPPVAGMEIRGS